MPCGLMDFGIPITLNDGTVLGNVVGGQILPENPDDDKFRSVARELGINEDAYIEALHKVGVKSKSRSKRLHSCWGRDQHVCTCLLSRVSE